ncbi:MAG: DUF192 domain-containing protein [Rhodobacter sp.]|nr:DUF192 domain-containing protein [Rhodobacter sp.]
MSLVAAAGAALADCAETRADLRGDWGTARFTIEVADEPEEVQRGLMFRESMPANAGMLFIYDRPQLVGFWMKNTLIPLDMVFVGSDGVVRKVHANAIPGDETTIIGGRDIQFVLEINGGMASMLGIGPGTELRHPRIDQAQAAWACEGQ